MDANELREQLTEAVDQRKLAEKQTIDAVQRITELLRQVADVDGVTMVEAAKIIGVSRQQAHNMLRGQEPPTV